MITTISCLTPPVKETTEVIKLTTIKIENKTVFKVVGSLDIVNRTAGFEILTKHKSKQQLQNKRVLKVVLLFSICKISIHTSTLLTEAPTI